MASADFSDSDPRQILDAIVADGKVDDSEVAELRRQFDGDWVIDRAEAELIFEINRNVQGQESAETWSPFFVEAISKHVVFDMETPGEIDHAEGDWLGRMLSDEPSQVEVDLLKEIKKKASLISGQLADQLFDFQ